VEALLFKLAFTFYTLAFGLAFGYLFSRKESLSLWMWRLLGVGVAAHAASFGVRLAAFWSAPENRFFFPIHTMYGALSWLAFSMAAVFWVVEGRHRLNILGAFVLPWSWLAAAGALGADPVATPLHDPLRSYWMDLHPMVLIAAYSVLANAFGVGLALLVQERQVKSRKPSELCFRLPSLEELDQLNFRLIAAALPWLTAGIVMGAMWASRSWGTFVDAKVLGALVTWLGYAAYLGLRYGRGMRGRRSVYVSMAAFASLMVTFIAVDYLSRFHGYLTRG
jgi:ABC-type transport system involved in cytochrome c biogenesis permease subunit